MAYTVLERNYIYKISLFICLMSKVNALLLVEFTRVSILKGKICKSEDTSFTKTGIDSFLCALLCVDRKDCFGTFYSMRQSRCVGCCKFYNASLGLEEFEKDATANYDFKKSPDCNDVGKQLQTPEQETGSKASEASEDNRHGMTTGKTTDETNAEETTTVSDSTDATDNSNKMTTDIINFTTDNGDNKSVVDLDGNPSNDKTTSLTKATENFHLVGKPDGDSIIDIATGTIGNTPENNTNGVYNDDITKDGTTAGISDSTIHKAGDSSEIPVGMITYSMDTTDHGIDNRQTTDVGGHNGGDDTFKTDASTTSSTSYLNSLTTDGTTASTFDITIQGVDDNSEIPVGITTDSLDISEHGIDNRQTTDVDGHFGGDDTFKTDASTTSSPGYLNSITTDGTTASTFDTTIQGVDDNSEIAVGITTDSMDTSDHGVDNGQNTDGDGHNDGNDMFKTDASTTSSMNNLNSITHATDDLQNLALGTYSTGSTMSTAALPPSSTLSVYSAGSTMSTATLSQSSTLGVYSTGSTMSTVALSQSLSSTYSMWSMTSGYSTTAAVSTNDMSSTVTYALSTTDSNCGCYLASSTYIYG